MRRLITLMEKKDYLGNQICQQDFQFMIAGLITPVPYIIIMKKEEGQVVKSTAAEKTLKAGIMTREF